MAIVNDRHNASKPVQVDPKTGKPMPTSATPVRASSPTMDSLGGGDDKNGGFFGSFFASKNKKKMAAMEAPPPTLKASGTLSEREGIEVEIISTSSRLRTMEKECCACNMLTSRRAADQLVLQHR